MKEYQLQYLSVDSGEWETFACFNISDFDLAIDKFNQAIKSDPTVSHRIVKAIQVQMMFYQPTQEGE